MIYLVALGASLLALLAASIGVWRSGRLPRAAVVAIEASMLGGIVAALATVAVLIVGGPGTSPLLGGGGIGVSVHLDAVAAAMLALVTFVGWVVTRFSLTYLDGEARQGRFMAWLCLTLAGVLTLVVAGNLALLVTAWAVTGVGLGRLLLFYPERAGAQRAARKKFVFARLSDATLVAAALLLARAYGTTDIAAIDAAARAGFGGGAAVAAAALLAVAALLKSAQFPTHGWLTEVMEAPTPVSALLHAGVINAGGFLLIRFADVLLLSPRGAPRRWS